MIVMIWKCSFDNGFKQLCVSYLCKKVLLRIKLLTIEAWDMMWSRPESTNIDRGGAKVNIGILRLTLHHRALTNWRFAVLNSHFWCWDSYFLKEAIFFCIVGLPLFGKEGSVTPVFKILVRALHHVQCLNSQQLFYYRISLNKKATTKS